MPEIERPQSLTNIVLDQIRASIVDGDLPLGLTLSERRFADELKVSKTPVREAFAQLKNEGLVIIQPQRGARVFTLSAREVREICEFRRALESFAARLALEQRPGAFKKAIQTIVEDMRAALKSGDLKRYLTLDTRFHMTFLEHCGNSYMHRSYELFSGKIAALRTHLATKPDHTRLSFEEHERILAAIEAQDADALQRILEQHIGRTRETYEIGIEDIAAADKNDARPPAPPRAGVRGRPRRSDATEFRE